MGVVRNSKKLNSILLKYTKLRFSDFSILIKCFFIFLLALNVNSDDEGVAR